jgi:hypothetical protein
MASRNAFWTALLPDSEEFVGRAAPVPPRGLASKGAGL